MQSSINSLWRWCGRVVQVPDRKSLYPEFKFCLESLFRFVPGSPWFNSAAGLVHDNQLVCLLADGILVYFHSLFHWPWKASERMLQYIHLGRWTIHNNVYIHNNNLYNYPLKGRWIVVDIHRDVKRRGIYPLLFTDPEGDSCFSIFQIRWIKKHFFNFFFWNFRKTKRYFSHRWQNSEYPRIFRVTGANQNARKLLSTDLVNTNSY